MQTSISIFEPRTAATRAVQLAGRGVPVTFDDDEICDLKPEALRQ